MKKNKGNLIALILIVILIVNLVGCGVNSKISTERVAISLKDNYPLNTDETLTIWSGMGLGSAMYATADDLPYIKELEKRTGVNVSFVHPPKGQESERLKIMLAAGDTTD
ncbi:MAG: hypothetical protein EOM11_10680, partial [Erysipelotrichia bacterium]|nr:hypothetical protein [Erysipelotrichia bacterium]